MLTLFRRFGGCEERQCQNANECVTLHVERQLLTEYDDIFPRQKFREIRVRASKFRRMAVTDNPHIYEAIYSSLLTTFAIPRHKIQIILIKIILSHLCTHLFSPDHDFPCRGLHISGGELLVDVSAVVVRESVLQTPGSPRFRKKRKAWFPTLYIFKNNQSKFDIQHCSLEVLHYFFGVDSPVFYVDDAPYTRIKQKMGKILFLGKL